MKTPNPFKSNGSSLSSSPIHRKWRKVLYTNQGVPDNFVSPDFLSELKINLYVKKYELNDVIIDAGSIYQQLCCILAFMSIYFYLLMEWVTPFVEIVILFLLIILGYFVFWPFKEAQERCLEKAIFEIRSVIVFSAFVFLLAPILHSLLATVSTDSIYAMATFFLIIHWVCFDYANKNMNKPGSNTTALSSALLAALCLGSRLPNPYHMFALMSTAAVLLALWPTCAKRVRIVGGKQTQIGLTSISIALTNLLIWPIAVFEVSFEYQCLIAVSLLISFVGINFFGPWLLVQMQSWKRNIHGPWDEATVQ